MVKTLEVHDLSCGACAETIRTALDLAGFKEVKVNLRTKPHTVSADIIDDEHLELMKHVLRSHDYPLIEDELNRPDTSQFNFS